MEVICLVLSCILLVSFHKLMLGELLKLEGSFHILPFCFYCIYFVLTFTYISEICSVSDFLTL